MTDLREAARYLADQDFAWQHLDDRAHLDGWAAARRHGLDVATCDAIVGAAVAGVRNLISQWADGQPRQPANQPEAG
jgi:hypothetical protein